MTTHYGFANISNCLQSRDAQRCVPLVVHEAEKQLDELGPFANGEFDRSDGGHELRADLADPGIGR